MGAASRRRISSAAAVALVMSVITGIAGAAPPDTGSPRVIPAPASMRTIPGASFEIAPNTEIVVPRGSTEAGAVGTRLAEILRPSTGYALPIVVQGTESTAPSIRLKLSNPGRAGAESYRLDVTDDGPLLTARTAEGLFRGVQTLRQLLPSTVESSSVQPGPWTVPGVHVVDGPRFAWRGTMLDVSRHFFTVEEVKRYIDLISIYKINRFHIHLSDDQGWRIFIDDWPLLATYGGSTEVGGGPGGHYTKAQYTDIVRYAADRYITVVPEIDSPGHTNAALASYAELNCDGIAPPLYTGTDVGFSSLCIDKEITYEFLDDVVREISALSPGPYYHVGGDEAHQTSEEDYIEFMGRIEPIVHRYGKVMMGWEEIVQADVASSSIAQHWSPATGSEPGTELAREAVRQNVKLVMSPAHKAYLEMTYDANTPLGLSWAGFTNVQDSYEWDPTTVVDGVGEGDVLGVEGPLWSETLEDIDDIEFMAFPRLPSIAEIGWSPAAGRSWAEYRTRLAAHGPRWDVLSVNFYRSPEVAWE